MIFFTFSQSIYTGLIRCEILGLKWSDDDFNDKRIHVNSSFAYVPISGYILTKLRTKSSKRQIPTPGFVLNEFRRHKDIQDEWKELVSDLYQNQDLVICTNAGTVQNPRNVNRVMKRITKKG